MHNSHDKIFYFSFATNPSPLWPRKTQLIKGIYREKCFNELWQLEIRGKDNSLPKIKEKERLNTGNDSNNSS